MKSHKHDSETFNAMFMVVGIVIVTIVLSFICYALTHNRDIKDAKEPIEVVVSFNTESLRVVIDTYSTIDESDVVSDTEQVNDVSETKSMTETEEISTTEYEDTSEVITESQEMTYEVNTYEEVTYEETTYNDRIAQANVLDIDITDGDNPYLYKYIYDDPDAVYIAKTIGVEAPYCTKMEQAAVAWCILNRVDSPEFPNTVYEVVTAPNQFGYFSSTPIRDDLYELALDVLNRWKFEHTGYMDIGRVLPKEYMYFWGDCIAHNYFRINETDQIYWDWSLPNPYEE